MKESIIKLLEDYIETIDYKGAYFYKKYYLAGLIQVMNGDINSFIT